MKFLDVPALADLTSFLDDRLMGNAILHGRAEVYSCKDTGDDKRLRKHLEKHYQSQLKESPAAYSSSPLGSMQDPKMRRHLINMIITMNSAFPDYDFSSLTPDHFVRRFRLEEITSSVNNHLAELEEISKGFLEQMWRAIDDTIDVNKSKMYSYVPDLEGDPFSTVGCIWSFNYFFYNKEKKQILYFTCMGKSHLARNDDDFGMGEDGYDSDERELRENEYHVSFEDDDADMTFRIE